MTAFEFLNFFNSIKPSYDEILTLDKELTDDVVNELLAEYDFNIFSESDFELTMLDLVKFSNISSLSFSDISFESDPERIDGIMHVASIDEKGLLFIHLETQLLYFKDDRLEMDELSKYGISESDFFLFYCNYLTIYFNRIFRDKLVEFDMEAVKQKNFPVFYELISELTLS